MLIQRGIKKRSTPTMLHLPNRRVPQHRAFKRAMYVARTLHPLKKNERLILIEMQPDTPLILIRYASLRPLVEAPSSPVFLALTDAGTAKDEGGNQGIDFILTALSQ